VFCTSRLDVTVPFDFHIGVDVIQETVLTRSVLLYCYVQKQYNKNISCNFRLHSLSLWQWSYRYCETCNLFLHTLLRLGLDLVIFIQSELGSSVILRNFSSP
jgi:hypothetical protein